MSAVGRRNGLHKSLSDCDKRGNIHCGHRHHASPSVRASWEKELKKKPWLANPHQVYIANDIAYVVARDGDTFQVLGKEFDISWKKLVKYNDLHKEYTLEVGDIIYLKEKRKKAAKPHTVYIVKDGDSMHSISQKYGIRLKNLYKMNRKDAEYVPEVGDRLD